MIQVWCLLYLSLEAVYLDLLIFELVVEAIYQMAFVLILRISVLLVGLLHDHLPVVLVPVVLQTL